MAIAMLSSGGAAQGYSHSHAGGSDAHTHHAVCDAVGEHDHGHHHDHDPHQQAASKQVDAGSASHSHLSLWGFDFTLPTQDEHDGDDRLPEPLIVLGEARAATPVVLGQLRPDDLLHLLGGDSDSFRCTAVNVPMPSRRPQVDGPLLCERARFERTGVLRV